MHFVSEWASGEYFIKSIDIFHYNMEMNSKPKEAKMNIYRQKISLKITEKSCSDILKDFH